MAVRQDDDRHSWRLLQAALVLILCRDERHLPTKLRQRMLRWMQRSPENLVHLFEIARIDQALGQQKLMHRHAQLLQSKPRSRGLSLIPRRAALIAGTAVVALVLGISISAIRDGNGDAAIRHMTLADGSIIHVLRGSDVDVEFSERQRLITLSRGEAVFDVAKDSSRPFVVRSPVSDSIAVGTRFGIVIDPTGTTTTVSEGEVRVVVPADAGHTAAVVLRAGHELQVVVGASQPRPVTAVDAERKISWSEGWLAFDGETLENVAKTFNRYSDARIEITQPELANMHLTYGRFEIDKPESLAVTIGKALNAPVTRDSRNVFYIGDGPRKPE
jgi:transmembrane sensor